jgi:transcription initiation factor TFIIE subunit alpha
MRNLLACSICQTEVVNKENEEDIRGNKDRMQRLNRQTKGIVDLLKKMERVELPK